MSKRTFINQSQQIGNSESYDITNLSPGAALENSAVTLQDDLNALRAMVKAAVGGEAWYSAPDASLSNLAGRVTTAEGDIDSLEGRVTTAEGDIDSLEGRATSLESRVTTAEGDIDSLEGRATELEGRMAVAESDIDAVEARMSTAESDIDALEGRMTTAEGDIDALEVRMSAEEARMLAAEGEIDALQAFQTTAEGEIDSLQAFQATAENQIAGLQQFQSDATAHFVTLDGRMDAAEADISALDGRVTTAESDIDAVEARMSTAEGEIDALQAFQATAEGQISQLESDVADLGNDKVSKSGDTMTGALSITAEAPNGASALATSSYGKAFSIANTADGVFFEANAALWQVEMIAPDQSGFGVIMDPAQIAVTQNDPQTQENLALTNIQAGVISLLQNGAAAVPTNPDHVVNKAYVDAVATGLKLKAPVKAAEALGGGFLPVPFAGITVDGVAMANGDRAFFFDPQGSVNAGIWQFVVVSDQSGESYSWTRPADYADGSDASSTFFFVQEGDTYADTSWVEISEPAVVGTDSLAFSRMFSPGDYSAGAGLDLSAEKVFSIAQGGVVESMIGDGEVSESKLSSSSVTTAKIADAAVTNAKLEDGAVDNSKISANTITEDRLAFSVYTETEVNSLLDFKLSLSGGQMDEGASVDFNGGLIVNLADLGAQSDPSSAANKKYVDESIAGLDSRVEKVFAEVIGAASANVPLFGGNAFGAKLDTELPQLPTDEASFGADIDVYLNGQLLRAGAGNDVNLVANNDKALALTFPVSVGDVICVIKYS